MKFLIIFFLSFSLDAAYSRSTVDWANYFALGNEQTDAMFLKKAEGGGHYRACSATLLNPWTVLTAAHCVNTKKGASSAAAADSFETGYGSDYSFPEDTRSIQLVAVHPSYDGNQDFDLAILKLAQPIYEGRTFATLGTHVPKIGDIVIGYGYGALGDDMSGTYNIPNSKLAGFQSIVKAINRNRITTYPPKAGEVLVPGTSNNGDSGGGIKNSSGALIAVISAGTTEGVFPQEAFEESVFFSPDNSRFISQHTPQVIKAYYLGGKTSDPTSWGAGKVPENVPGNGNQDVHYQMITTKDVVVDQDLNIDFLDTSNQVSVQEGATANFNGGFYLRNIGSAAGSLKTPAGSLKTPVFYLSGEYTAPKRLDIRDNGILKLDRGTIISPVVNMMGENSTVSGNGIFQTSSFIHTKGDLSPGLGFSVGTLQITGSYQSKIQKDMGAIKINITKDRNSLIKVGSVGNDSIVRLYLKLQDRFTTKKKYTLLESVSPISHITAEITLSSDQFDGTYSINNNSIDIEMTPKAKTTSATVSSHVFSALNSVYNLNYERGEKVFKMFAKMSDSMFDQSLPALSLQKLHLDVARSFENTFSLDQHRFERVSLFLQKERFLSDFKSFKGGQNSSKAEALDASPFSFYASGEMPNFQAQQQTQDGLTTGFDYALGKDLVGVNFSFKKTAENFRSQDVSSFNVYRARKNLESFYDLHLSGVYFQNQGESDDFWGASTPLLQTYQSNLQGRYGFYGDLNNHFWSVYGSLGGLFRKRQETMFTQNNGLDIRANFGGEYNFYASFGGTTQKIIPLQDATFEFGMEAVAILPLASNDLQITQRLFDLDEGTFSFKLPIDQKPLFFGALNAKVLVNKNIAFTLEAQGKIHNGFFDKKTILSLDFKG